MGRPRVYPTGTVYYDPEKAYNGYTIYSGLGIGSILVDMNGKPMHVWKGLDCQPTKMLPGGKLLCDRGLRDPSVSYQDFMDVIICDWNGNPEWVFNKKEFVEDPNESRFSARQHHDIQRYGDPVYYTPGEPHVEKTEKTLILCHQDVKKNKISSQLLEDDVLIEVDNDENIIWEWHAVDHLNEFGFDDAARNAIYRDPNTQPTGPQGQGDWLHLNCAAYLGPNKWYDAGDERFHPDNIIADSREGSFLFIIDHETGKIVWRVGPDYTSTSALRILGPIIGPHATHMIPKGLPGAGNILIFDNGGWAGYGVPDQTSRTGMKTMKRDGSRVIEIDPITLEIVWKFDASTYGTPGVFANHYFYSPLISNAQRLPNGNTLIDEGCDGHIIEVTADGEVVWDYHCPYRNKAGISMLYRCYRVPYEWVPQVEHSAEVPVEAVNISTFQLPGAADPSVTEDIMVEVEGAQVFGESIALCVEKV